VPAADDAASWTVPAAADAAFCTVPVADDAASWTVEAAAEAVLDTRSAASDAVDRTPEAACPLACTGLLPITLSLSRVAASRARSTRRSTILAGVTFSVRASTSWPRLTWVRSISRRICSGSLGVLTAVLLPRP